MTPAQYKAVAHKFIENPEQLAAYESRGNCGVLAGPGSGKTKVLTAKVARMLCEDVTAPRGVACITYSNECRTELLKRLSELGVGSSPFLFVGTVHGYCLRHILRPFAKPAGFNLPETLRVAGDAERTECGQQALERILSADEKWGGPDGWGRLIERFRKSRGRGIEGLDDCVPEISCAYQAMLRQRGLIDYDDITNLAAELVTSHQWVRDCIAAKHPILAIDEYQDLGAALHDIVVTLCDHRVRVFGVGDPDQCIYQELQDARPELLAEFADRSDVERVDLRLNYRSGTQLVIAAAAILGDNRQHRAHRSDTGRVKVHSISASSNKWLPRQQAHAKFVVRKLLPSILNDGQDIQPGDIGILVQDRFMAQALAIECATHDIKYIRLDRGLPYERTSLVSWIADATTWCVPLDRGEPPRMSYLQRDWIAIDRTGDRSRDIDTAWTSVVSFLWKMRGQDILLKDWLEDFDKQVVSTCGLADDALERELASLADLIESTKEDGLHHGTPVSEFAIKRGPSSHLTIVTLHSAKGLEFPVVVMPMLDNGVIPRYTLVPNSLKWREQRRLFYVGVTRAMDDLHAVYSKEHGMSSFLSTFVDAS
ncbi:MAG: ATP-dependent helicase [Phycisphaerales bacterium]|nr:ATP-dependent helicase [Phycisphaerales bacterium]